MSKNYKIVSLQIRDIKKVKAVDIYTDNKDYIEICGKNGSGKTSTIESIAMAFSDKLTCDKPIREGEKTGSISVNLGDFTVKRKYYYDENNKIKSNLSVVHNANNQSKDNKDLFSLLKNKTIDVLEFSRLNDKKKIEVLKDITGLDFSDLDSKYEDIYQKRTYVFRERDSAKKNMESLEKVVPSDFNENEISLGDLYAKKQKIDEFNKEIDKSLEAVNRNKTVLRQKEEEYNSLKEQINILNSRLSKVEKDISDIKGFVSSVKIKTEKKSTQEIEERIKKATENQHIFTKYIQLKEIKETFNNKDLEYKTLSKKMDDIKSEKADILYKTRMPIDGLSFDSDGLFYKGIPFSQLSSAETIRVSMAIAIASNPNLKVIYIKDGSLLDNDNLNIIKEIAEANDYQIWIERVLASTDGTPSSIFIEEGEIVNCPDNFKIKTSTQDELSSLLGIQN